MDVELINPFINALLNVLSTMAQTEAKPGKPFIKTEGDLTSNGEVSGLIGLAGDKVKGSLCVSFSDKAILSIASKMLGQELTEIDGTISDAVGEITNMVTGGAKRVLSEKGHKFKMAIPSVIAGKNHTIAHKTAGPVVVVPFETDNGSFLIEICFEE